MCTIAEAPLRVTRADALGRVLLPAMLDDDKPVDPETETEAERAARFERDASPLPLPGLSSWLLPNAAPQALRLLGDYQFSTLRLGDTGGLRLTGGLLLNQRIGGNGAAPGAIQSAQPYAGVGYASGSLDGRWGFSADLGLAGNGLGPLRLDRQAGGLGIDGQPRLGPLLRLGMTLSF